jgi:hypothetical protein
MGPVQCQEDKKKKKKKKKFILGCEDLFFWISVLDTSWSLVWSQPADGKCVKWTTLS